MIIGVFKQGLQHKPGHLHSGVFPGQRLQFHLNPVSEADCLYLRIVLYIFIFHGQGHHILAAAGDITVV